MTDDQKKKVVEILGKTFQLEMSGVIRYLHYSFMITGHHRIPIQAWFRSQANESMAHAILVGEKITALGGHPPVFAEKIEETHNHSVNHLLQETLEHESKSVGLYTELSKLAAEYGDIALEELARSFVREEVEHVEEVRKMLRDPNR